MNRKLRFLETPTKVVAEPANFCGRAITYNAPSQPIFGMFIERIHPEAFVKSLNDGHDIICTHGHDRKQILGRTSSGTLKLINTNDGLEVECSIGQTTYARDLVECINRGDIRGMSFTFCDKVIEWNDKADMPECTIKEADIFEVAFTSDPAYLDTNAQLRELPTKKKTEEVKQLKFSISPKQRAILLGVNLRSKR